MTYFKITLFNVIILSIICDAGKNDHWETDDLFSIVTHLNTANDWNK